MGWFLELSTIEYRTNSTSKYSRAEDYSEVIDKIIGENKVHVNVEKRMCKDDAPVRIYVIKAETVKK